MQLLKSPEARQEVTTVSLVDTTDNSVVIRQKKISFLQNPKILTEDYFLFKYLPGMVISDQKASIIDILFSPCIVITITDKVPVVIIILML